MNEQDIQKLLQGGGPPAPSRAQVPDSKIPPEVVIDQLEMTSDEIPDNCFTLSEFTADEVKLLKKLVGKDFKKVKDLELYNDDYKNISFMNIELSEIKKKLSENLTYEAEKLIQKLVHPRIPYRLFKDKKNLYQGTLEYTDGMKISYIFLKNNHIQMSAESTVQGIYRMIEELAIMMKALNMINPNDGKYYVKLNPANNDPKILEIMEKACKQYGLIGTPSKEKKDEEYTKTKVIAEEIGPKTPTIRPKN